MATSTNTEETLSLPQYPVTVTSARDLRRGDIVRGSPESSSNVRIVVLDIYDDTAFHGMEESGVVMQYSVHRGDPVQKIGFVDIDAEYHRICLRLKQSDFH